MISLDQALSTVYGIGIPLRAEKIALTRLRGRVLTDPIVAPVALPHFDNSAVDGYALGSPGPGPFRVVGRVAAGEPAAPPVNRGEAVRISTGAPVPTGAYAIVMQEDVRADGNQIVVSESPKPGLHIRRRGEQADAGMALLQAGHRVNAATIGLLATLGMTSASVFGRPKVGIVETGRELLSPGGQLGPGQVYSSNGIAIAFAAEDLGADVQVFRSSDDPVETRDVTSRAMEGTDVVVTTGGISVGDHDLVRQTWTELGVAERFWRVAIKPGRPVFLGTRGPQLAFGLPGNPAAALIAFHLFVRPVLRRFQGLQGNEWREMPLGVSLNRSVARDEIVPVQVENGGLWPVLDGKMPRAAEMAMADGFARVTAGSAIAEIGSMAPYLSASF